MGLPSVSLIHVGSSKTLDTTTGRDVCLTPGKGGPLGETCQVRPDTTTEFVIV